MSANPEIKILNVGDLSFPMSWEEWHEKVEKTLGIKLTREIWPQLDSDIGKLELFNCVRLDRSWVHEAFLLFSATSPLISQLQAVDFFFKNGNQLWPQLLFKMSLHSVILYYHSSLNIKGSGLIIGSSTEAIQAAHVLVELGLSHITLVVEDDIKGEEIKNFLKQTLFQVRLEVITRERVILLPGVYSVLICCEDLKNKQDLLTSILYFNYLEKKGLVINAGATLGDLPLIEEAHAIGATVVDINQLQIHQEVRALQKVVSISNREANSLLKYAIT